MSIEKVESLYVHIPYCEARCHYCDFNSYAGREREFGAFVDALCLDLERAATACRGPVSTVFLGGGTPSVLPAPMLARILAVAREVFGFTPNVEITSEANPGSLDQPVLEALLAGGLTRLSLGVQSLDDGDLRILGRVHSREVALDAVRMARRLGVPSLSLDLIYGVPGQTVASWTRILDEVIALGTDHLSLYGLIVEEATAFGKLHAEGRLVVPDDDSQADMYEATAARMRQAGFAHYEISNYARPGHACRHNLTYWDNGTYVGVGPGAVSYVNGWRWTRMRRPGDYIRRVLAGQSLVEEGERVGDAVALAETLMLGLRTLAGVDLARCAARYPSLALSPADVEGVLRSLCADAIAAGILGVVAGRAALTEAGLEVSNGVMERLLEIPQHLTRWSANATLKAGAVCADVQMR